MLQSEPKLEDVFVQNDVSDAQETTFDESTDDLVVGMDALDDPGDSNSLRKNQAQVQSNDEEVCFGAAFQLQPDTPFSMGHPNEVHKHKGGSERVGRWVPELQVFAVRDTDQILVHHQRPGLLNQRLHGLGYGN